MPTALFPRSEMAGAFFALNGWKLLANGYGKIGVSGGNGKSRRCTLKNKPWCFIFCFPE